MKVKFSVFILSGLSVLMLAAPASAQSLSACTTDADCMVTEDVCPGTWTAINKDKLADHKEYVKSMSPVVDCQEPDYHADVPEVVVCKWDHCQIPQEEKPQEENQQKAP